MSYGYTMEVIFYYIYICWYLYIHIYTTLTSQAQKLEKNREREARHVLDSIFLSTSIRAQEPHGPQYIQLSLPPSLRPFDLRSSSSKNELKIYILGIILKSLKCAFITLKVSLDVDWVECFHQFWIISWK